jgi:hypothetical protein
MRRFEEKILMIQRPAKHLLAISAITLVAGTLGVTRIAQAGQGAPSEIIYRGEAKTVSGITPRAWGSGVVTEDTSMRLSGPASMKIVTHGMYQGGSLLFGTPVNLNPYVGNKDAYLQFTVSVASTAKAGSGGGMMGMMGGPPGASMGRAGGGRQAGGGGMASMMGGAPGGSMGGAGGRGGSVSAQKVREIENLRVQMINTAGKATEFLLPMEYAGTQETWKTLTIPLAATGLKAGAAQIKEIRIFGDSPGTLNVGQIRALVDATPITLDTMTRQTVGRNERRIYRAKATAGNVPLKVTWDFDASDGIQEEKVGRAVQHTYRKTGDYKVTVTVSDVYGTRAPKTTSFVVFVP